MTTTAVNPTPYSVLFGQTVHLHLSKSFVLFQFCLGHLELFN